MTAPYPEHAGTYPMGGPAGLARRRRELGLQAQLADAVRRVHELYEGRRRGMKQYKLTVRDTSEQDFWIEAESEEDAKQRFWEEMDHYALSDDEVTDNDIVRVTELGPGDPDYDQYAGKREEAAK